MDGIFGGKNVAVNVRDFQWKTFTPMELNMDGWGSNEKYPHALGEPATFINRSYLKLKSELMPYAYSIARESVDGLPMIRAMFLEYPNTYTLGKSTQYQFMYGPSFLVAPIYQETKVDEDGNDIRNGIYLPEGRWIDYFSGELYEGNRIINNFASPLWKLPVFIKAGAIIPRSNPNNNVSEIDQSRRIIEVYPEGSTSFTLYDDDGKTEAYRFGASASTRIESNVIGDKVTLTIAPTVGTFEGMTEEATTMFVVNTTQKPKKITAQVGKKRLKLKEVASLSAVEAGENVFYYEEQPNLNRFATECADFANVEILKTPQLHIKLQKANITNEGIQVDISGYAFEPADSFYNSTGALLAPTNAQVKDASVEAYTVRPTWDLVENADYYEIAFNDLLYSTIQDSTLLFEDLEAETTYEFKVRAVNKDAVSDWTSLSTTTKSNPLEFALEGITAKTSVPNQGGQGTDRLFDLDDGTTWHTQYGAKATPFEMVVDLKSFSQLDKFHYIPREDSGNGTILKGEVAYSLNGEDWSEPVGFAWEKTPETKVFTFAEHPTARYIKIDVDEAVGGYGSGRELYVFKVPGTESYIPGDINNDGLLDRNDLISYTNYTGLRQGDSDFEGYISGGDINKNGLIDAYDISTLTTQIEGGASANRDTVAGTLELLASKVNLAANEIVEITVKGKGLKAVNALSFALPYLNQDYEYLGLENVAMEKMENLTRDRLHTNGTKALYPMFVNVGEQATIQGDRDLFVIKLKAKRAIKFNLKAIDGFLVDKNLGVVKF